MADDNQALLLQVSADLKKMENAFKKASGTVDKESSFMERRAKQMADKIEASANKIDVSKALGKVLESSRLKVLDEGAARISVFGGALEALGPVGIAAGAGIAAVAAAFAGAREAAKFADDINDTANRLHVTTDALQEYRYAIRAAGGEEAGADEALEGFSVTLGKAQQGLVKSQRAFLALGFSKEQIKGFTDVDSALTAVTDKIAGLSSVQKDAVIDQLGLTGLKPLIDAGTASMQHLREEAHKVGIVMDAQLVKRGGDLNDEFETVSKVIDVQLKSALVDIGPILLGLLDLMSQMATAAADVADQFRKIEDRTTEGLKSQLINLTNQRIAITKAKDNPLVLALHPELTSARLPSVDLEIVKISAEIASRLSKGGKPDIPKHGLNDTSKTGEGPKDDSAQRSESVNAAVAAAERQALQALLGLTDDIEARAALQKQILAAETAQSAATLAKQRVEIEADKGIGAATKAELTARLAAAATAQAQENATKARAIDAETQIALAAQTLERHKTIAQLQIDELRSRARLADTARERAALELQALALQKGLDDEGRRNDLNARQLRANASAPDGNGVLIVDGGQAQAAADKANAAARDVILDDAKGPLQKWIDANLAAAKAVGDAYQQMTVDGIEGFNRALTDSILNAQDFGQAFESVIRQVLADFIQLKLQSAESSLFDKVGGQGDGSGGGIGAFFSGLFGGHRASGGPVEAGKAYMVGERGQEAFLPGVNGTILSAETLKAFSRPLTFALPSLHAVSPVIHAPLMQIAPDPNVSQAYTDDLNRKLRAVHDSAVSKSLNEYRRTLPGLQAQFKKLGTT